MFATSNRNRLKCATALGVAVLSISASPGAATASSSSGLLTNQQFDTARQIVQADDKNFAGFSVNVSQHELQVYRVTALVGSSGETSVSQRLAHMTIESDGSPKVWSLSIQNVSHSGAELATVQDAIATQQPWFTDARPFLATWYIDPSANAVHVDVTSMTAQLSADALVFGDRVRLAKVSQRPAPSSKTNDGPPWWGGSTITVGAKTCTAGFPAISRSNNHQGMLTAGHCGTNGTTVNQGSSLMGTVTFSRYGGGSWDAAFVDAPNGVQGYVYNYENSWLPLHGFSSAPLVGNAVCTDGYVTGQNCSGIIQQTDVCVFYDDGTFLCGLDYAASNNGTTMSQHGDSGGPVYHGDGNGGIIADGIISGNSNHGNANPDVYFTPYGLASGGHSPTPISAYFRLVCISGC